MVIILNGERKEIPSCFEELTTKQWELIVPELAKPLVERDYFHIFNILSGTSFTDYHATAENEVTIWNAVRWIVEQPFVTNDEFPKVLEIEGKLITLPKRVEKLSIGQNIHLKQLLNDSKYVEENLSSAVAIYLQPIYDNKKFDYDRALELKAIVEQMPMYLIRPIGFFLLTSASVHGNKHMSNWRRILNSLTQRCARMLPRWLWSRGLTLSKTLVL